MRIATAGVISAIASIFFSAKLSGHFDWPVFLLNFGTSTLAALAALFVFHSFRDARRERADTLEWHAYRTSFRLEFVLGVQKALEVCLESVCKLNPKDLKETQMTHRDFSVRLAEKIDSMGEAEPNLSSQDKARLKKAITECEEAAGRLVVNRHLTGSETSECDMLLTGCSGLLQLLEVDAPLANQIKWWAKRASKATEACWNEFSALNVRSSKAHKRGVLPGA